MSSSSAASDAKGARAVAAAVAVPAVVPDPASTRAGAGALALRARGLGKCYRSYARPFDRLRQVLPFVRRRPAVREFWALRDVDLELPRGCALGIVGRNGSGKSTLLQILGGTLAPTSGEAEIHGRAGGLLELGSGFHPEFTGRENARLQGILLGCTPDEVDAQMEAIARFAEIGPFLDEPVKTYSSGMFVRLAFAVQAVLPPELLIIDEALAVGDAAFQIKCMTHMRKLLDGGTTLLFASHDLEAVRSLCQEAIWLEQGEVRARGCPRETTSAYVRHLFGATASVPASAPGTSATRAAGAAQPAGPALPPLELADGPGRWGTGRARITGLRLQSLQDFAASGSATTDGPFRTGCRLRLEVACRAEAPLDGAHLGLAFSLRNTNGLDLITFATYEVGRRLPPLPRGGVLRMAFEFDNILPRGEYGLVLAVEEVHGDERRYHDFIEHAMLVRVSSDLRTFSVVVPPVAHELVSVTGAGPQ